MKTKKTSIKETSTKNTLSQSQWIPGEKYFLRLVTHYLTGELVRVDEHEIVLTKAAWIADTGRYQNFLESGSASEVECYPENEYVFAGRGALIDAVRWPHALPRAQK